MSTACSWKLPYPPVPRSRSDRDLGGLPHCSTTKCGGSIVSSASCVSRTSATKLALASTSAPWARRRTMPEDLFSVEERQVAEVFVFRQQDPPLGVGPREHLVVAYAGGGLGDICDVVALAPQARNHLPLHALVGKYPQASAAGSLAEDPEHLAGEREGHHRLRPGVPRLTMPLETGLLGARRISSGFQETQDFGAPELPHGLDRPFFGYTRREDLFCDGQQGRRFGLVREVAPRQGFDPLVPLGVIVERGQSIREGLFRELKPGKYSLDPPRGEKQGLTHGLTIQSRVRLYERTDALTSRQLFEN